MTEPHPVELMRFEMDRLVDYSDESILSELRRVAGLLPPGPISRDAFNAQASMSEGTLRKRFGGWRAALEAAGLGDRYTCPGTGATDEAVIEELQQIAASLGKTTLTSEDLRVHARVASERAIAKNFGYLSKALEAAGLEVGPHSRRWTDGDYFDNLLEVWTHFARAPKGGEMDVAPSRITSGAYRRKFGTWVKAKRAFVDRVNDDLEQVALDSSESKPEDLGGAPRQIPLRARIEDRHDIPVGLRYDVLRRDSFKCVLCGRSPATDSTVVLHVDHIRAFSCGGKTRRDNLRSTCRECNLGKGTKD